MDITGTVLLVAIGALLVLSLAALVDIARLPGLAFRRVERSKGATWFLVAITGWFGASFWFLRIRREVVPEVQAARDVALGATRAG
jgi:hypothetical protein